MNLFGRRVRCEEVPGFSPAAFGAGLYAGTIASNAVGDDCEVISVGAGEGDQRANVGGNEPGQVANSVVDNGVGSTSNDSWSGSDGAGGGNWWKGADANSGDWTCDFSV